MAGQEIKTKKAAREIVTVAQGNSKVGQMYTFSTLAGSEMVTYTDPRNGEKIQERGTCGGCCAGCEKICYAKKRELPFFQREKVADQKYAINAQGPGTRDGGNYAPVDAARLAAPDPRGR